MEITIFEWTDIMDVVRLDNSLSTPIQKNILPSLSPRKKKELKSKLKGLSERPEWVRKEEKNAVETGNVGENIAHIYLRYTNPDTDVKPMPDYAGYDFRVGDLCYEVKTSCSIGERAEFYIYANEISACLKNKKKYKLLFIQLNSKDWYNISNENISLFIMDDFYKKFEKYQQITASLSFMRIQSVKISLDIAEFKHIKTHPFSDEQIIMLIDAMSNPPRL